MGNQLGLLLAAFIFFGAFIGLAFYMDAQVPKVRPIYCTGTYQPTVEDGRQVMMPVISCKQL